MAKRSKPRAGSLAYSPRKRAKKEVPRIHSWKETPEINLMGFAGYKAGMTHVMAVDHGKNSPTSGMEVFVPVTIVETPPMVVFGVRLYEDGYSGKRTRTDVISPELDDKLTADLNKRISLPKKKKKSGLEKIDPEKISDIRLLVCTQPRSASLPKKKPDVMEIAIGGGSEATEDKLEFAREILGKEVKAEDVFKENSFVDITAVTKGKGFQGPVKRWGIIVQSRKVSNKRRHVGSGGPWHPARRIWRIPMPGQMGYHTRTENNKFILKIGDDGEEVTPKGGFLRYGKVGNYVMLKGSVAGPAKRLIRINLPKRPHKEENYEITHISTESKQGV